MPFFVSKFRKFLTLKDSVKEHFGYYKKQYILLTVLLLSVFIIGIIVGAKRSVESDVQIIPDTMLVKYLTHHIDIGGLFLSRLFSIIGLLIIIWLLSFNRWTSLLSILILMYASFMVGSTIAMLLAMFKFTGLICVILIYLPCHLVRLFCMLTFSIVCMRYKFENCNYGGSILSMDFFNIIKNVLLAIIISHLVSCLLELILLPWVGSAMIIA